MWRVPRCLLPPSGRNLQQLWKRFFLSDAYTCQEIWDKRMTAPELKSYKVANLHYELDLQFSHFAKASPLEVDFFANIVRDEDTLDEVQDIIHKFRLSPETLNTFPSTGHAIIRYYLALNQIQPLLQILNDRLGYGIFPDDFCNNLLMDTFLKRKMYREAAKVATIQMLQESYDHPITKYMSVYSCLKYLKEPLDWHEHDPVPEPEPEDDIKVRLKFLINPYFDGHFDLREPEDLIGKTFCFIGKTLSDAIGNSLTLYGLILRKRLEEADKFIDTLISKREKGVLCKDTIALVNEALEKVVIRDSEKEEFEKKKRNLVESLKKLDAVANITIDKELLVAVEEKLKEAVEKHEMNDIQNQCKLYEHWESERIRLLHLHLKEQEREKRLAEVNIKLRELEEKEEELYYFEMKDKIEIQVEEKLKELAAREEKLKDIKKVEADEYIPPDIQKQFPSQKKLA